jgi:hypothetical protein
MRRIIFRGKKLDDNEFVYGTPYTRFPFLFVDAIQTCEGNRYLIHPETLGQFTGFFDKLGNEIFEGDVVICHGTTRTVIFDENFGSFEFDSNDRVDNPDNLCLCCDYYECEVIDNIYDYKGEKK